MLDQSIQKRFHEAVAAEVPGVDLNALKVRPCPDSRHGDYQSNALIAVAKERKLNPRQLAERVRDRLVVSEWCDPVEVAGPGFLNFRLKPAALAEVLAAAARGEHLFLQPTARPRTIVIDFSSPNVAKPMHVGHIRSTILGDSLARVLRRLGHRVITDNHLGDWGTQFGMLLRGWKSELDTSALAADPIAEMERIYRLMHDRCQAEADVLAAVRAELVKLQAGDPENLALWREMIRLSQAQFDTIYGRLEVKFDHTLGESFYNPRLPGVVQALCEARLARTSEGAVCVFSDGTLPPKDDPFKIQRDGEWVDHPALIRKSDGGYNYTTTDLATLAHRVETWQPDEIIYVTDGRQQLHFQQVFSAFRRWRPDSAPRLKLAHVWFGSILGEDRKPFKTRSGGIVKLADLLDEAEERTRQLVAQLRPELAEADRNAIARVVGLGAVKYADLLPNRQSDYVFDWDRMLALQGNTAPYLQYAYTRTRSLARKAAEAGFAAGTEPPRLTAPEEIQLAKHLLKYGSTLEATAEDYRPNFLCNYLFELAGMLSRFWENCPVLKAEPEERASRLLLTDLTGRVLHDGLAALGIGTTEQM